MFEEALERASEQVRRPCQGQSIKRRGLSLELASASVAALVAASGRPEAEQVHHYPNHRKEQALEPG